tara:strand:+ start:19791 stop:20984 length:1194 start_codon:yes stop_codon:yes gene_type:complete
MKRVRWFARAVEQEARQLRGYFLFAGSIKRQRQWRRLERANESYGHTVLLDISKIIFDGEQGRRIHALVNLLTRGGYRVWLTPRVCFFQNANKVYKWRALEHVYEYGMEGTPAKFDLCITDRRRVCPVANRTLRLTSDTQRQLSDRDLPVPYTIHPDHMDAREDLNFQTYRDTQRRWLVFFGGDRRSDAYHPSEQYTHFKSTPRPRLVQLAEECFQDNLQLPDSEDALNKLMDTDSNSLVILDSARYRVAPSRWLPVVSRAKFFLAAPGQTYPHSHNCIESLAIGTIPILEYNERFQPALEHGVNCLVYRGEQQFRQLMTEIRAMPESSIQQMRQGAIAYYDEYLSPQSFVHRLTADAFDRLHMYPYLARPGISNRHSHVNNRVTAARDRTRNQAAS